jgi:hypothetical protein
MHRRSFIGTTAFGVASLAASRVTRAESTLGTRGAHDDTPFAQSGTLYVNPVTGDDSRAGTREAPLRTLPEAARRVSRNTVQAP